MSEAELLNLAASLSPKMRFNIVSARALLNGGYGTRAHMHLRELTALRNRGLTEYLTWNRDRLTSLGLEVRNVLLSSLKGEGNG